MAARKSYIGDTTFSILMSFIFAAIFGLGIGFAYAELQGQGWAAGIMVAGLVAVVGGSLLSFLLTRDPLPPPNTVRTPAAPARPQESAHFVSGGATATPSSDSSVTEKVSDVSETVADKLAAARDAVTGAFDSASDKVRGAAAGVGAKFDDTTETASEKVQDAADTANQRVRDAAKAAGEAARSMSEPVTDAVSGTADADGEPRGTRPDLLASARDGNPDDLKKIKGVGPKLEEALNEIGVWHFDQIASWNADEVAWIDTHLVQFKGRCSRDEWVSQAKVLASGGETEFSQRVDKGDVY